MGTGPLRGGVVGAGRDRPADSATACAGSGSGVGLTCRRNGGTLVATGLTAASSSTAFGGDSADGFAGERTELPILAAGLTGVAFCSAPRRPCPPPAVAPVAPSNDSSAISASACRAAAALGGAFDTVDPCRLTVDGCLLTVDGCRLLGEAGVCADAAGADAAGACLSARVDTVDGCRAGGLLPSAAGTVSDPAEPPAGDLPAAQAFCGLRDGTKSGLGSGFGS